MAEYIAAYKRAGVGEFIFSGWPTRDEMRLFAQNVLPRIRRLEAAEAEATAGSQPGVADGMPATQRRVG